MRRSRISRALALATAGSALVLACADFDGEQVEDEPSPAVIDASVPPSDATSAQPVSDSSASDATPPPAPRLPNGGFEAPGGGCGPGWAAFGEVSFERVPIARNGAWACRVCNLTPATTKGVHATVPSDGGATRATAWFRAAPDGGNVGSAWVSLYALFPDEGGVPTPRSAQAPVANDEWRSVTTEYPASPDVTAFRLHIEAGDVGCLLFDDVTVDSP